MNFLQRIWKRSKEEPKIPGKPYPEFNWRISIEDKHLYSIDWNGCKRNIDLNELVQFYVRTTDQGPFSCDVWWGVETENQKLEIPQGCNGEEILFEFTKSLSGFEMKGMNCTQNKIHVCWEK